MHHAGPVQQAFAVYPGVENTELDVRLGLEIDHHLVEPLQQQVVNNHPYFHTAVGRVHGTLENQTPAVIGIPEVGLDIERGCG